MRVELVTKMMEKENRLTRRIRINSRRYIRLAYIDGHESVEVPY